MDGWDNFLIAEAAASATLTGLLFVSVSINLSRLTSLPSLPSRAFGALFLLLTVLMISSVLLVPGQSTFMAGLEVLAIGSLAWLLMARVDIAVWKNTDRKYRQRLVSLVLLDQLALLPYFAAGIFLILGKPYGMYWLVPAVLFSMMKAMLDAWVLLVEINR